jgi:hypothetical protein
MGLVETSIIYPIFAYPPKNHHHNEKRRDREDWSEVSCEEEGENKECNVLSKIQESNTQTENDDSNSN